VGTLDDEPDKYRDHEFDRHVEEYHKKLHATPRFWDRPSFYVAIGVALTIVLYFIFGR
jgi:hypothetical protein